MCLACWCARRGCSEGDFIPSFPPCVQRGWQCLALGVCAQRVFGEHSVSERSLSSLLPGCVAVPLAATHSVYEVVQLRPPRGASLETGSDFPETPGWLLLVFGNHLQPLSVSRKPKLCFRPACGLRHGRQRAVALAQWRQVPKPRAPSLPWSRPRACGVGKARELPGGRKGCLRGRQRVGPAEVAAGGCALGPWAGVQLGSASSLRHGVSSGP